MIRSRRFDRRVFCRRMARLAFVAILLLALVPTLGRIAQAGTAGSAAPSWTAMCTARGLEPVLLPSGTLADTCAAVCGCHELPVKVGIG